MLLPTAPWHRRACLAAATVAALAGATACGGDGGNDDGFGSEPVEQAGGADTGTDDGSPAAPPEPPDPCTFVDPTIPANAAAVVVDMAERHDGAGLDLGTVSRRSCTFGSGTDVMVVSTVTYTGEAPAARDQLAAEAQADGGQVLDVELRSLPRSSLVTHVTGTVSVTVLEGPAPFELGFFGLGDPASAVTAAEAVLAAT